MSRCTTVSCPGKVLIAGGYLVLEPENGGLVVATASRFYTVVRDASTPSASPTSSSSAPELRIKVNSPQFVEATWIYEARVQPKEGLDLVQVQDGASKNPFVQEALEAALKVSTAMGKPPGNNLLIDIVGDNDFYSQERGKPSSSSGVPFNPPPFAHLNTTLAKVHKTGLGSSAAMVTSLVAGVLLHLSGASQQEALDQKTLRLFHNVAQYAHSRAQGKVGSGFDVSAAIFGSQVYYRFAPECLQKLLDQANPSTSSLLAGLSPSSPLWKTSSRTAGRVEPFSLPPMLTMLLADVYAGSNTPSMVKNVLKWKASDNDSDVLWSQVRDANLHLGEVFNRLQQEAVKNKQQYVECIKRLASMNSAEWTVSEEPTQSLLIEARDTIQLIRQGMKAMGTAADVPIEPDEQTRLIDRCISRCNGVLGGGVPGAGGYDALWVIVLDATESNGAEATPAESQLRSLWHESTEMSVRPLSSKARIVAGFAETTDTITNENLSGLRVHDLRDVTRLQDVVQDASVSLYTGLP
ncbi:Phosphomevalonate kinase [Cystobasidium minutum MCA 4210]|uniref:Phosphomevalonate kinase n=1 Tax=Cystobasidium minutum MCA 4210 TaxID=1397322 RepID=UPI0034CE6F4D|eukprot:jgi/Rhomi1/36148/CE36147_855